MTEQRKTFLQSKKSLGGLAGGSFAAVAALLSDKTLPEAASSFEIIAFCAVCSLPVLLPAVGEWIEDMRRLRYAHEERLKGVANPIDGTRKEENSNAENTERQSEAGDEESGEVGD